MQQLIIKNNRPYLFNPNTGEEEMLYGKDEVIKLCSKIWCLTNKDPSNIFGQFDKWIEENL